MTQIRAQSNAYFSGLKEMVPVAKIMQEELGIKPSVNLPEGLLNSLPEDTKEERNFESVS